MAVTIPTWLTRLAGVGATQQQQNAIQTGYVTSTLDIRTALDTIVNSVDNATLLNMLISWAAGNQPFAYGFPGGGLPFGTRAALLTGLTADDTFAISAGTGVKLSITGGGGSGVGFGSVVAKTANYTIVSGDSGTVFSFNGSSLTATLPATAPPGPWSVTIVNLNASALTISPNGRNLNGAASSVTIAQNQATTVWSDGTNYEYGAGGGGSGTVTSVTAGDTSIVIGGTAAAPTVATGTLDVIATDHPPVAAVPMNAKKITGLANGTVATDAAAFGQIPTALPPNGAAGGSLTGTYPNPTVATIPSAATGTTQAALDNTTKLSTTAYADAAVGVEKTRALAAEALLAPKASPTFTGTTTAPEFTASGLTGATAASRYVGATTSGAPASGTFAVGDFVIDQTAAVWVCTTAGSPGTWTKAGGSGGSLGAFQALTAGTNISLTPPSGYDVPGVALMNGIAYCRGVMVSTGSTTAGATLATLPAGWRPAATKTVLAGSGNNNVAMVMTITTGGAISGPAEGGSGNQFSLDGIWFVQGN